MCANIIKTSRNKIILCYIFGIKLRVLIYTSYSENSATFFKICFVHDRFINLIVIIKRAKWRERKTYRIQYATIISMKNGRSFHGRGMQTNHVQASSLSPLSHPSCNRYLRTRVPQVWFTREPCAEFAVHLDIERSFYEHLWLLRAMIIKILIFKSLTIHLQHRMIYISVFKVYILIYIIYQLVFSGNIYDKKM